VHRTDDLTAAGLTDTDDMTAGRRPAPATSGLSSAYELGDRAAAKLLPIARRLDRYPAAARFLRGDWLGHPLHPALTDLPIGFWTSAWVMDLTPGGRTAARRLIGLGVLSAVPAALAGAADWPKLSRQKDPAAVAHLTANLTATALYALSWRARHRGHGIRGFALAQLGAAAATAGGALGGHLAFGRDRSSTRVDLNANDEAIAAAAS
jgi:uncharacterized membrane protein